MKRYLYTALICFLIALTALLFIRCTPSWQGQCRHKALFANSVIGEHYPVYTLVGRIAGGEYHAQSVLFLEVHGSTVEIGNLEHRMADIVILTEDEYQEYLNLKRGLVHKELE